MIHFDCDYMAGAHPEVLKAIVDNNNTQTSGYGEDDFCRNAKCLIRKACGLTDEAAVHFMVGGTQTNATVLDGLLGRTEGVIAAETAHINVHESGAIELTGHKVIALPQHNGKLHADDVRTYLHDFYADETWPHMVAPGAVYISFPTELGTIYTLEELTALSDVCHEYHIPLYVDGARLGFGLAASNDVTLRDVARLADVFYIGGTKMGALFGEAVVCADAQLLPRFFTLMKAHGSVLAKGRLLGMQFGAFFTNDLYLRIGRHGVALAQRLRKAFEEAGYAPFIDSPTNQQFFLLPNALIDRLMEVATFEYWGPRGAEQSKVRFVTSWETTEADIEALEGVIKA
ncbi:MAG: aminotransferase class I/II-fold pyridoxal phosphate-dependent enzyme [Bacteroidales bacterium]|nr:aminotransferase class I/II-fold pyridoxal phosphate-dependent enzyme [Bacteroidales bacterium]